MVAHIPQCFRVSGGTAVLLAVLALTGCDDSAKVKELQEKAAEQDSKLAEQNKKLAALEARLTDLEGKLPIQYSKPDKDDEYVSAVAGAALDALMAGDVSAVRKSISPKLEESIKKQDVIDFFGNRQDYLPTWVQNWNPGQRYKSYSIEKVVLSPTKDEAIVQGSLSKDDGKKGSFSLTLVKEKEKNKFLIDASSAKP
jgi:hypothetical protein